MQPWLVRGVAMAVVNAAVQTWHAKLAITDPASMHWLEPVMLAGLVGVAGLWGGVDGWLRLGGERPGMTWFYAALFGGVLAGLLGVIGQGAFVDQTGVSALGSALTGGAAFTALLIMLPAELGLLVGKHLDAPGDRGKQDGDTPVDEEPAHTPSILRGTLAANGNRRVRPYPRRTRTAKPSSRAAR